MATWHFAASTSLVATSVPLEIANAATEVARSAGEQLLGIVLVTQDYKDKSDKRILCWTIFRIFVLQCKANYKVETSVHLMRIRSVESHSNNQLSVLFGSDRDARQVTWYSSEECEKDLECLLLHLCTGIKHAFPHIPIKPTGDKWTLVNNISVKPGNRMDRINSLAAEIQARPLKPCAGYSVAYACMCSLHESPIREEIIWDIETVVYSQNCRTLCVRDFDHLDPRDCAPLVAALEYNCWFTELDISGTRVNEKTLNCLLDVISSNVHLTSINLSNMGLKSDFMEKMGFELKLNTDMKLLSLTLSHNPIDDKGLAFLCDALRVHAEHLTSLQLKNCGVGSKGVARLSEAICGRSSASLQCLNLAKNSLRDEKVNHTFFSYLTTPNQIRKLDLSHTDLPLDLVSPLLHDGCCEFIEELNLSNLPWSNSKKHRNIMKKWEDLWAKVARLRMLNLAGCKLPVDALKCLLSSLGSNSSVKSLSLNLSSNDLKETGARALELIIPDMTSLVELDISDNGFEKCLELLVDCIADSKSLKKLVIDSNFDGVKQKHVSSVLSSAVRLVQEEGIVELSVADCRLRSNACSLINALGTNSTLTRLNISGNAVGDLGARLLSRALQINCTLQEIQLDNNSFSSAGLIDIANALEKNYSVRALPLPVNDICEALKANPSKTIHSVQRIQRSIQRNQIPQKLDLGAPIRMQHSLLLASSSQTIEKLVSQVRQTLDPNHLAPGFRSNTKLTDLVSEARTSSQLLPTIQESGISLSGLESAVEAALKGLKADLDTKLKETSDLLIQTTKKNYPVISESKGFKEKLGDVLERKRKCVFPDEQIQVMLQASVHNAFRESFSAMAGAVAECVMDSYMDALALTRSAQKSGSIRKSTGSADIVEARAKLKEEITDVPEAPDSPATLNRNSLKLRKVRPISVLSDSMQLEALEEDDESKNSVLSCVDEDAVDARKSPSPKKTLVTSSRKQEGQKQESEISLAGLSSAAQPASTRGEQSAPLTPEHDAADSAQPPVDLPPPSSPTRKSNSNVLRRPATSQSKNKSLKELNVDSGERLTGYSRPARPNSRRPPSRMHLQERKQSSRQEQSDLFAIKESADKEDDTKTTKKDESTSPKPHEVDKEAASPKSAKSPAPNAKGQRKSIFSMFASKKKGKDSTPPKTPNSQSSGNKLPPPEASAKPSKPAAPLSTSKPTPPTSKPAMFIKPKPAMDDLIEEVEETSETSDDKVEEPVTHRKLPPGAVGIGPMSSAVIQGFRQSLRPSTGSGGPPPKALIPSKKPSISCKPSVKLKPGLGAVSEEAAESKNAENTGENSRPKSTILENPTTDSEEDDVVMV